MNACDRSLPCLLGPGIMNCMLSSPSSSIRNDVLDELCNARIARAMYEYVYLTGQTSSLISTVRRRRRECEEKARS